MRLEITGCTGAGKTTFAAVLRRRPEARGVATSTPTERVLGRTVSAWLERDSTRNAVLATLLATHRRLLPSPRLADPRP